MAGVLAAALSRQVAESLVFIDPRLCGPRLKERIDRWLNALGRDPSIEAGFWEVELGPPGGHPARVVGLSYAPGTADAVQSPASRVLDHDSKNGMREVWFEYDLDAEGNCRPPGVFVHVHPHESRSVEAVTALAKALLEEDGGAGIEQNERALAGFARWTARLLAGEPGAYFTYVAHMPARPGSPIRVNIRGMGEGALERVLGLSERAGAGAAELLEACRCAVVTLDLYGERVGERRGVELMPPASHDPETKRDFLALFVANGLLDPLDADALARWSGDSRDASDEGAPLATLLYGPGRFVQRRYLNHLKLVLEPGRPVGVKAYLGFMRAWIPEQRPEKVPEAGC